MIVPSEKIGGPPNPSVQGINSFRENLFTSYARQAAVRSQIPEFCRVYSHAQTANALDASPESATLLPPILALIVYRLGQEILNLQSGVRFPVGAPKS
jgi:hypothetical protein